ncbi:unnamed protein product [Sphenostylis stenocarpa]|uniref:Uncharacterized protein n=1 Tax=Sphenostylis stenocarpa TaxID=92480 RepID=A0AA86T7J1_9FABA|nr:unnamed protein product [Sphenostylis stenocarpa]
MDEEEVKEVKMIIMDEEEVKEEKDVMDGEDVMKGEEVRKRKEVKEGEEVKDELRMDSGRKISNLKETQIVMESHHQQDLGFI